VARPRSPNRDKAYKIYKRHKGKIRNKEIAEILEEDPKTVSAWKRQDKWVEKLENSKNNSKNKSNESTYDYASEDYREENIEVEKELNEIKEVEELTEKQILFCIYMAKYFNATKAYQKAYGCDKITARVNGCKLLTKTNIQMTVNQLKQNEINQAMLSPSDIFQRYLDIAMADIHDYATIERADVCVGIDPEGKKVYQTVQALRFKDSEETDGTLIKELKKTKYGFSIKLHDPLKALEWLADHMYMATEEQRARVDSIRAKMEHDKEILDLKKKEFERNDW
jgi:phage terminase small subunit